MLGRLGQISMPRCVAIPDDQPEDHRQDQDQKPRIDRRDRQEYPHQPDQQRGDERKRNRAEKKDAVDDG